MPVVSVIIPAFNAERCIGNIINNVINQTFSDWELIVVDDGSSDSTPRICDEYAKMDIRIKVVHQKNAGVSAARNTGLERAAGDYVIFIDADDYIIPQYIEALYSCMSGADLCVFPMKDIFSEKDIPSSISYTKFNSQAYSLQQGFPILVDKGLTHPPFGKIFSKAIIAKYNIHFEKDVTMGEDFLFNMAYLDHCKNITIGKEHIYYYIKGNSVLSKTIRADYADLQLRFYSVMESFCINHDLLFPLERKRLGILYDCFFSIAKAVNLSRSEKVEAIRRVRQSHITTTYLDTDKIHSPREFAFKCLLRYPFLSNIFIQ